MKKLRVFKYRDLIEGNEGFIIASDDRKASRILESHTQLKCKMVDCRPLEDFPQIMKHYEFHGECVYMSEIKPF